MVEGDLTVGRIAIVKLIRVHLGCMIAIEAQQDVGSGLVYH